MKKVKELNSTERFIATEHAKELYKILKSVTDGSITTEDHKFSIAMCKLRGEIDAWGFWGDY